jgi:polysaccharide biosynthesis PFTS motif protein
MVQMFSRIQIILGSPLSDELEDRLSNTHDSLIRKKFYSLFRAEIAEMLRVVRQELELNKCSKIDGSVGLSDFQIRLGFQQKIILKTLYSLNLKKAIAYSTFTGKNIIFPISKSIRRELTQRVGLRFNHFWCAIAYSFLVSLFVLNSSRELLFSLFRFHSLQNSIGISATAKRVYLHNFPIESFPNVDFSTHNFVEWLTLKFSEELVIVHNNENFNLHNNVYPPLNFQFLPTVLCEVPFVYRLSAFLQLGLKLCFNIKSLSTFISMLTQVDEIYTSILLANKRNFFSVDVVFFSNSVSVQRPLWTFVLETRPCQIVFAHYSASAEPSKSFGIDLCDGIWHLSAWSKSWVVDDIQIEYAKKMSDNYAQEFEVVGVPYWSGRIMKELPQGNCFTVSIFDTYIRANQVFSANIIDDLGWNDFYLEWIFISEILEATKNAEMTIIHKRKRPIEDRNSSMRQVNNFNLQSRYGKSYFVIDESFSAESLVDLSHLVIVKPISTVAFIAKERAKPVIFFDPTGNLEKEDPMLRGIPLASNRKELYDLISSIYKEVKI